MWILPKQLILASALDTEALISDSDEFSQVAEQSLMWRSKPSPSRTWSQRWKRETWMRHLSGRTLRHSQQNRFAAWWTSSLVATRANRSQQQVADSAQKTHDTSGRFYAEQYELFSPEESSSKTSKDTSRLDSPQLSATWKKMVTEQRGEYSVRLKSEQATREKESSSSVNWPTPDTCPDAPNSGSNKKNVPKSFKEALNWPALDASIEKFRLNGNSQQSRSLETMSRRGELSPPDRESSNSTGKNPERWPTPTAGETDENLVTWEKKRQRKEKEGINLHKPLSVKVRQEIKPVVSNKLNPNWVEQLMGLDVGWTQLPTEWTDSDCWATGSSRKQQQEHGQF